MLELLREGEEKLVNAVERAIEEKFFLPFADQHTFTVLRKEAFSSLREFAQKYLEELLKIENTTTQVEVSFDGVVLRGGVDAVIREGERLTLWICRVSWGAITPEEVAFQLGVFIKASGLDSTSSLPRAFFANLGDSLLEEIVIDERGLQDVGEKLKEVLLKIKSGQFDKVLGGESCKRCDYSEICRFCYPNFS
ncbi:MAG: ATP-dependent helicase UvrD/PcrA [Candidatus Atribacteria bacterium]|nr:ATP-dependent helicase UvrD/PcrA [Candidatus Atribacteria bacterium]